MARRKKGLFPLLRDGAPLLENVRKRKGGGLDTGIRGRVRIVPNLILEKRGYTSPPTQRKSRRPKVKYVSDDVPVKRVKKPKPKKNKSTKSSPKSKKKSSPKKKKQRPKVKAKKTKARVVKSTSKKRSKKKKSLKGSPPKLVREYAQSMAKQVGVSYKTALNSEPVQNYWRRQVE